MRVSDLMSAEVITVAPGQGLTAAVALLQEFDVRHLPVLDTDTGKLVGILTNRQIEAALEGVIFTESEEDVRHVLAQVRIEDIMETDFPVIGPNATVGEAARRLVAHKVTGLPVVHYDSQGNDALVGLVTATDLLRYLADLEGDRRAEG